ncbi:hypothetical protein RV420_400409 [Roseovarius sp. EC-SD190]|nr:hypothetical protein RV420_400409 [Roseovarius sp. EC-SD190]
MSRIPVPRTDGLPHYMAPWPPDNPAQMPGLMVMRRSGPSGPLIRAAQTGSTARRRPKDQPGWVNPRLDNLGSLTECAWETSNLAGATWVLHTNPQFLRLSFSTVAAP